MAHRGMRNWCDPVIRRNVTCGHRIGHIAIRESRGPSPLLRLRLKMN